MIRPWNCGRKSASQGFSRARYNLGLQFEHGGEGVAQPDIEKAIDWYVKAAASKNPDAFTNLGFIFESGKRGEPDFDLAQQYYRGGRRPWCVAVDGQPWGALRRGHRGDAGLFGRAGFVS